SVVYTCTDFAGNAAEAERLVIVADDMDKPVLELNGPRRVSVILGNEYNELGAMCRDLFDGVLDIERTTDLDTGKRGVYNVTYSCEDSAGNEAVKKRAVAVAPLASLDTQLPGGLLILPSEPTNYGGSCSYTRNAVIEEEYRPGGLFISHRGSSLSHIDIAAPSTGEHLRVYTYTEDGPNTVLIPYTVLASITPDPEYEPYRLIGALDSASITTPSFNTFSVDAISHPDMTLELTNHATHIDRIDGFRSYVRNSDGGFVVIYSNGEFAADPGSRFNHYTICESGRRTADPLSDSRPDTVKPTIHLIGPIWVYHKHGTDLIEAGATCTDDRDPEPVLTRNIGTATGAAIDDLNTLTASFYRPNFLQYECTDETGNMQLRNLDYSVFDDSIDVYLIDLEGPTVDSVPLGIEYVDPGATCRNAFRGETALYTTESFVDIEKEGRYHIHYTCADEFSDINGIGFAIRIVDVQLAPVPHVISAEPVTEACPAPISLEPGISAEDG
ncbi:MAG: DUF5011 domain-containing protein, partial [Alphaproteobacteria bacterium]|nr:DUF5011 domain-containing protein [Alphaproteobacteria bacterium]MDA8031492.1 DUF5011 domain-containing protein [Alphaproteobacteria bacterium]